jgi:hypothetical protein
VSDRQSPSVPGHISRAEAEGTTSEQMRRLGEDGFTLPRARWCAGAPYSYQVLDGRTYLLRTDATGTGVPAKRVGTSGPRFAPKRPRTIDCDVQSDYVDCNVLPLNVSDGQRIACRAIRSAALGVEGADGGVGGTDAARIDGNFRIARRLPSAAGYSALQCEDGERATAVSLHAVDIARGGNLGFRSSQRTCGILGLRPGRGIRGLARTGRERGGQRPRGGARVTCARSKRHEGVTRSRSPFGHALLAPRPVSSLGIERSIPHSCTRTSRAQQKEHRTHSSTSAASKCNWGSHCTWKGRARNTVAAGAR